MARINAALLFEKVDLKQAGKLILALAFLGCSLSWEGCAGIPQTSASSPSPAQHVSIQTPMLPGASVGSSYRQVLSVSGGQAPYNFDVSAGTLPPGLVLNPLSGSISGTPTRAGTFPFGITVTAERSGGSGEQGYSITILPLVKSVNVQISPAEASLAAGGKLLFAAAVSNTSNTAVTWSASAGSISANGLLTAPVNGNTNSITITASSLADPTVHAIAKATITSSAFTIATTSIPSATQDTPYAASLSANGGQPPYQWSIEAGSLPSGLQLNAITGALSGSAIKAGTFSFNVLGSDSASHIARRGYSLTVSSPGQTCGPPAYNCSRTDFNIAQIPSHVPNVGNLTGANTIVTDPDFGNRIVRITDWNTDPGSPAANRSYVSAASGSADENLWNVDSTMFILQALGDIGYPYTFDSSTMQAARMYVSSDPSRGGMRLPSGGVWSRVDPNVLYTRSGTVISKYNFSDRSNPPVSEAVYDFTSSTHCLPAGFSVSWTSMGGVSAGDTTFAMAFSNSGAQGTGIYAVAYVVGKGCSMLNTQTGQVTGDWGATGGINIKDRWTIHNAKLSKDGNWLVIMPTNCTSSICSTGPYFWQLGTTNVSSCGDGKTGGQKCTGHWTEGYSHWINNYDNGKQVSRPFSAPTAFMDLTSVMPLGIQAPLDEHASWNNADAADSLPFFLTYWSPTTPFPAAWYNEITGVAPDGSGKVWRFAHSFITGQSQLFSTAYGIGSVSQDGRFFIFSSDWMGTLGSQSAASTCIVGKDCRGDVFVLELR